MANLENKFLDATGLTYLIQKIKTVLNSKQDALTFDSTPTANSTNPVTSGGIKTELDKKKNKPQEFFGYLALINALGEASQENPVQLTGQALTQFNDLASKVQNHEEITILDVPAVTDSELYENTGEILLNTVRYGSSEVSSSLYIHKNDNGYWGSLTQTEWQKKLTFDDTPTSGSSNPVKSGGIHTAIQDAIEFYKIPSADVNTLIWVGFFHEIENQTALNNACEAILTALKNNKKIDFDYSEGHDVTNIISLLSYYYENTGEDTTVQLTCFFNNTSLITMTLTKDSSTSNWSASMGRQSLVPSVQGNGNVITDVNTTNGQFILYKNKTFLESGDVTEMTNAEVDTMMTN